MSFRVCAALLAVLMMSTVTPLLAAQSAAANDSRPVSERLLPPDNLRLPPSGAIRTPSGLRYVVLQKGKGLGHPLPSDTIVIDYVGWDFKGRMFDSSLTRGAPAKFELSNLIKGWQEGLPLMSPGDTFRFWIPGNLAYDGNPNPASPAGQLVFDITLHSFSSSP